jgi:multiple sugar transport system permease protein
MLTLLQSSQRGEIDWGLMQAGVIYTILPCVLIFLVLQKYYIQGLIAGGLKG